MRMLKIPEMEYDLYREFADAILETIPFSIVNLEYSLKLKTGFFYFWDMLYVPASLREYAMFPPKTHENVQLLHERIEAIIKADNKKKAFDVKEL